MSYAKNKLQARTKCVKPTLTDQSQATETDRNVIVQRFLQHGQMPGTAKNPLYADFSALPEDLRGFIHQAKRLATLKNRLPKALRGYSMNDLIELTPDELKDILAPPAPKPEDKPEEKK